MIHRHLIVVLAVAALGASFARAAAAMPPEPASHVGAAAAGEAEEEEIEVEAGEEEIEVELEFEEGEGSEEPASLPPECLLRTATPHVVARFGQGDLRLSLRYTADSSVRVGIAYWLKGAKGSARLGSTSRRLGQRGVLEMSRHLDDRTLAKLRAAKVIVVRLSIPHTPGFCKRQLTMRLTAQRVFGSSATWYQPA
jgi:hypothetical protein